WKPAISMLIGKSRDWPALWLFGAKRTARPCWEFLVDTFCLGVKNAFCNEGLGRRQIEDQLIPGCYQNGEPTRVGINYVKEIIYGAVDYARSLGFEPHPDFELSRHVLGSEEIGWTRNLTFGGPEGKPLYVAGPDDDAVTILQKLRQRL